MNGRKEGTPERGGIRFSPRRRFAVEESAEYNAKQCTIQNRIAGRRLSLRHSSEVMAVEDELVMKGLAFIRENADEGINAADVINILAVSKSVAQRRFQAASGRSIYETIIDQRLRKVMELLSNTKLTVRAIARMAGFKHVEHMNNLFKSKLGDIPVEYRKNS